MMDLNQDLLCWSPDWEDGWRMVLVDEPDRVIALHEAHFAMTRDGAVLKNRFGYRGHPKNDRLRDEGFHVLEELCKSA